MRQGILLVGIILAPWLCHADDHWTHFQNGGRLAVDAGDVPLTWSPQANIAWSVKLEGYGQSSPLVWGKQVYVTFCSGGKKESLHVRAIDLNSGETRWEHKLTNSTPEENSTYVSRAAPTGAVDENGIIAFFEGGNVVALDHQGAVRWTRDLVQDYGPISARHGLASSLEQSQDHVFVWVERSTSPYVVALSKQDGTTTWKAAGVGSTTWSTPRLVPVEKEQHLVLSASGKIVGLDPGSGERLWELEDVANNTVPTPIPLGDGRFLMGASEGRGEQATNAIKSTGVVQITKDERTAYTAEYLWRAKKATTSFGSPVVAGDHAYFVSRAGVVYCLETQTGKTMYAKRSAGSVWATPIHIGNRVYLFGREGTTTVIRDGSEFEILATNSLWEREAAEPEPQSAGGGPAFGGPVLYAAAVAGKRLILRRGDRVYCVAD